MDNKRLTIKQLEAMSSEELLSLWDDDKFPFEKAPCGACLTYHANFPGTCSSATKRNHQRIGTAILNLGAKEFYGRGNWLKKHIKELYAIRMKYDSIYRHSPEAARARS